MTQQVVKNIIPAIASTNALISAACVNECLKYRTGVARTLHNYLMYIGAGDTGVNSETFVYQRNPACAVCMPPILARLAPSLTLGAWLADLTAAHALDAPSLSRGADFLYLHALHAQYAPQLERPVGELLASGQMVQAADKAGKSIKIIVKIDEH